MNDYFIGLDMGTDSEGWAVTDTQYNIKKFNGKAMWGVELFDESNTAEERRIFRSGRRRLDRKQERIALLQMLFNEEIAKKDCAFFQRLKESNLYMEDKTVNLPYCVFADSDFTDEDYHKRYPTVFHLRKELMDSNKPHDIRLVYMALHHILKHRGHFLFDNLGNDVKNIQSFDKVYDDFSDFLADEYGIEILCSNTNDFAEIIKDKTKSKTAKSASLYSLLSISKKENPQLAAIIALICGQKIKFSVIFNDDELDELETNSISFSSGYDDKEAEFQSSLQERFELIEKAKMVYDWAVLADILQGEKYLSAAKVKAYDEHKSDLLTLKKFIKEKCPQKYNTIFKISKKGLKNYTAYSGKIKNNGHNGVLAETAMQDEFCSFLKKELDSCDKTGYEEMFEKIENGIFMPKQIVKNNGVIPMQLNRAELKRILANACSYLTFLNHKDENNITISDKILSIFDYRIPYYVGPLNTHSSKAWAVRSDQKIYPWNFNQVVDIDKSAENFITNLTSKCTYLPDKDVIPKNSLLYTKFMVLNELNNLKLNGDSISVQLKQSIYTDLFLNRKKVTQKALKGYIKSQTGETPEITGIDGDFKSNLKSHIELAEFPLTDEEKEQIITAITIFGDDKKLLVKRLKKQFANKLSEAEIKKITRLKYKDWSSLSKEFLTEIINVDPNTGEAFDNIINTLWNTNDNLMILLGSKYNFSDGIEQANSKLNNSGSLKSKVDDLYVSPKVKRPVYQSLKIVNEIIKIQGCAPKKIFVEMTRSDGIKGDKGRKNSRRNQLIDLYKSCKTEYTELYNLLCNKYTNEDRFRQDKLYLYFTQCGRCMYTGEQIDIDHLFDENVYDIDHIFPRSKIKDDSLDNRVLVKKTVNSHKDNNYPLEANIRNHMASHWKFLLDKNFISKKKHDRLVRVTELADDELSDFIARQLVETSQSTKAVATLLKSLFKDEDTEIVYVKASIVSDFRHLYKMIKSREVNDLHHAKDAYLNIVVGNVYNVKYTHNKMNFIKGLQKKAFSLNKMFDFDVPGAWNAQQKKSLSAVKRTMNKNNILYTRYSFVQKGGLFKINPLKKGSGQAPLKQNSPLSDISKYGGYDKPTAKYFSFIKYISPKGKEVRQFVPIDNYLVSKYEADPKAFLSEALNIADPVILISCVKVNTCIEVNGFRMNISSKKNKGKIVGCKPGMQLVLGYELELYCKKISKVVSKGEAYVVNDFDEISSEQNMALYKKLVQKMTETVYKVKYEKLGSKILSAANMFSGLTLTQQCKVLSEILHILHCNAMIGDLVSIGESKNTGVLTINAKISEIQGIESFYIVNQSVTGLFEQKINLLSI